MAITNHERVGKAMELLRQGLGPFVGCELSSRLYSLCEPKKRAQEGLSYNGLVQSWPEIARLARDGGKAPAEQAGLFECSRTSCRY